MTGLAWGALSLIGMFLFAALGDLVSEEIRGWLDLAPRAVLRLAAARLDPELRESVYQEEWLPELIHVLRGAESRPITRLIWGSSFAVGLLFSARGIARFYVPATHPTVPFPPQTERRGASTIVGVGAVASATADLLVRMGVDHLWLVDDDTIHSGNMGRITRKSG